MPTAFNIWVPQGALTLPGTAPEQPSVIYEGNAKILSGTVFKMWYQTGGVSPGPTNGLFYAESTDGINFTGYGSNPVQGSVWGTRVFKNGSTYYLYASTAFSSSSTILVFASPDGLTWTQQSPTQTINTTNSPWATGGSVGQLNVAGQDSNGVWHGYYYGKVGSVAATLTFPTGHATSTDLINWTPVAGNPVTALNGPRGSSGNFGFLEINGVWYGWSQGSLLHEDNALQSQEITLPSDIFRWSAPSPAGPWTILGSNSSVLYRSITAEGVNTWKGQVADPCIVSALGNMYMYHTASTDGTTGSSYTLALHIATSVTPSQLVASYEGIQNIPISGNPSLNLNVLGSDSFSGTANPLGGNWSPELAGDTAQKISGAVTNSAVSTQGDSYWNAVTWGADQWSQITVNNFASGSFIGASVRISTSGANTGYKFVGAVTGTGAGTLGNWLLQKVVTGTFTTLLTIPLTVSVGDVLLLVVIGTNLYVYYNGTMVGTVSDSSISSGASGFNVKANSASPSLQANASISAWSGGTFQNAPNPPSSGGSGSLAMMGCGQ